MAPLQRNARAGARQEKHVFARLPLAGRPAVEATVYRDVHGVPHVEAADQASAWYAMGYEEAYDALYPVQANVKRIRGQATRYLGDGGALAGWPGGTVHRFNDVVVRLHDVHLGAYGSGAPVDLAQLLAVAPVAGDPEGRQLHDNLVAYAAGIEAFREHLKAGIGLDPYETELSSWLVANGLGWVIQEEVGGEDVAAVTLEDVVSWGRWWKALTSMLVAAATDPTPAVVSGQSQAPIAPGDAGGGAPASRISAALAALGFSQSNGIGWTSGFVREEDVEYSGCVADPHDGLRTWVPYGAPRPVTPTPEDPAWFCHLVVADAEHPELSLDAFGYLRHASGFMFTSHNADVAFGGSASANNLGDSFLVRIDDPDGEPPQYYHTYGGSDRAVEPGDFRPITVQTVSIELHPSSADPTWEHDFWLVGPYGVVHSTTPIWVAEGGPGDLQWPASGPAPLFASPDSAPGETLVPAVVAHRSPVDPRVDGADHHSRFGVFFYEMMRASTALVARDKTNDLDAGCVYEICAVDREGRLFASLIGSIPRRGDDAGLHAAAFTSSDKFLLYAKEGDAAKPVPARGPWDRIFDWRFDDQDAPDGLQYLRAEGPGDATNPHYLPYVLHDPVADVYHPAPPDGAGENPGFATMSNDHVWHSYEKRPSVFLKSDTSGFNVLTSDSKLLAGTLEAGTIYHTTAFFAEALEKNQKIIDDLSAIDGFGPMEATGPMTPDEAVRFALSERLYAPADYPGPSGGGRAPATLVAADAPPAAEADPAPPAPVALLGWALPVAVRILDEAADRLDSVCDEAAKDAAFFADLWQHLHEPPPGSHWESFTVHFAGESPVTVPLRSLWVENAVQKAVPWYDQHGPDPGAVEARKIGMPGPFALIDFLWNRTRIGDGSLAGGEWTGKWVTDDGTGGLDAPERQRLRELVRLLVFWDDVATPDPERFRMVSSRRAAALLAEYRLGFAAASFDVARRWTPLFQGDVAVGPQKFSDVLTFAQIPGSPPPSGTTFLPLGAGGDLTFEVDPDSSVGGADDSFLTEFFRPYSALEALAFPKRTFASLFGEAKPGDPITAYERPPYDALYDGAGQVKTHLSTHEVNELTRFFLRLGGWWSEADQDSTKKQTFVATGANSAKFSLSYSSRYPLTRGLARVVVLRRLLEAATFLEAEFGSLPRHRKLFRAVAHDYVGTKQWPTDAADAPCAGGSLRAVNCGPAVDVADLGEQTLLEKLEEARAEGYQRKMLCAGGSSLPIVTLFPKDRPASPPLSFFWNVPGQRILDLPHAAAHMAAWSDNAPLPTHFADYLDHLDPEAPVRVYSAPPP